MTQDAQAEEIQDEEIFEMEESENLEASSEESQQETSEFEADEDATPASESDEEEFSEPVVKTEEEQLNILEALLFAAQNPLTPQALLERMPVNADLGVLLPRLKELYTDRGIELVEINGAYAFRTAASVADALTIEKDVDRKLSKAAMETLAVIAYHQPITRSEIENIRGVATHKGTIDQLLEMGWIKPGKRRETLGRPLTWLTTNGFLDQFGLSNILELPGLEDLKAAGLLDRRPAIDTVPDNRDLFDDADKSAAEVLSGVADEPTAATAEGQASEDEFAGYEEEEE
jgi:segregation and condensation protein B